MKKFRVRATALATILAILALLVPETVSAEDYIADAVQALQSARVYVYPGTEKTDANTASKLEARLQDDDGIVLVMLPASAETDLGADITTIASRLSDQLGNQQIIGLAIGNDVVGYAPSLPAGVAADQMRRASNVSNDPVTAMSTFIQNMHNWLATHPHPKPPPAPSASTKKHTSTLFRIGVVAVAIFLVLVVSLVLAYLFGDTTPETLKQERTKFDAPHQVSDLLTKIAEMRSQVHDTQLRQSITQMCSDTEVYFKKFASEGDTQLFTNHLRDILEVIKRYIDVQDYQRYYDDPLVVMRQGKEAIESFTDSVVKSSKRKSAASLVDFRVNTRILKAQRER